MRRDDPAWMWSEALGMLTRAEQLHRQFFRPQGTARTASWEPPVDVLELEHEVLILVALPGVDPAQVEASIEGSALHVSGLRLLPPELRSAAIHRLELPQGRFERHVLLPPGNYSAIRHTALHGCLLVRLDKAR